MLDRPDKPSAIGAVAAWYEAWEQVLSRFRMDSELTRLNSASGTPRVVSDTLWDVYTVALEAEQITEGLVNPLILNALVHAGYDRSFDELTAARLPGMFFAGFSDAPVSDATIEAVPALSTLMVGDQTRTLCVPEGAGLDLGGVAKGWAAHQAMLRLLPNGPALVSAGGDIAVSGPMANGEPWPIGVEDPFHSDAYLETIYLEGGGVATSGKDHRHWIRGGAARHHVIDPRTGLSAQTDVLTATVIAPTVMHAEALAKAVLISGSQAGMSWLDADERIEGLLVLDSGELLYSRDFEDYL